MKIIKLISDHIFLHNENDDGDVVLAESILFRCEILDQFFHSQFQGENMDCYIDMKNLRILYRYSDLPLEFITII